MPVEGQSIIAQLALVERERAARAADPMLAATVEQLKRYQQQRFELTYADLLADPRYAAATRFFLDEVYGPRDFSERDAQFARVVPALVRLFPHEVVETVDTLAQLHALSEKLDTTMAERLQHGPIDRSAYASAWQRAGDAADREQQVVLILAIGRSLERLMRKPLLRHGLHLMRGPATAAGLSALQLFLESGFDAFKSMGRADQFLAMVGSRERAFSAALFAADSSTVPVDLP